jgi:hypothetical protein
MSMQFLLVQRRAVQNHLKYVRGVNDNITKEERNVFHYFQILSHLNLNFFAIFCQSTFPLLLRLLLLKSLRTLENCSISSVGSYFYLYYLYLYILHIFIYFYVVYIMLTKICLCCPLFEHSHIPFPLLGSYQRISPIPRPLILSSGPHTPSSFVLIFFVGSGESILMEQK